MTVEDVPDRAREYTPEEEQALTTQLLDVTTQVDSGTFGDERLASPLLCTLHRALFAGVRAHAGKLRSRGFGSERLVFGPNRSEHRDLVPEKLEKTFDDARKMLESLLTNPDDADYESSALRIAVWLHAQVIRLHPFEDGNGRSSRLLMGVVLVRAGLRQIPVEGCKQEYLDCLNHYFTRDDLQPLIDLFLSVYIDHA